MDKHRPLGVPINFGARHGWVGCAKMERMFQLKMYTQFKLGKTAFRDHQSIKKQYLTTVNDHMSKCLYCQNQSNNHNNDYLFRYWRCKM
jgi:hypothetical protein